MCVRWEACRGPPPAPPPALQPCCLQVTLADVSARTCQFSLLGPEAEPLLASLGVDATALAARGHGAHTLLGLRGAPVVVAVGGGLVPGQGFTLIADESCAADLWSALTGKVGAEELHHSGCWAGWQRVVCMLWWCGLDGGSKVGSR